MDERQPLFFFRLPAIYVGADEDLGSGGDGGGTTRLGITGMDPAFWLMSFALLCLQSVVNILTAVVLYRLVVMQREAMQSYIIGYRDVIPVLFCLPLWLGSLLDIRNMAFMACLAFTSPQFYPFVAYKQCTTL